MRPLFNNTLIRRKLIFMIMLTSVAVMIMMRIAFFTYEYVTFRNTTFRQISILGKAIADVSTAALAFGNQPDAIEMLSALRAEPNVVAAALYDSDGKLFAEYPAELPGTLLPPAPGKDGYAFASSRLAGFEPVVQRGKRLGTLYLEFDSGTVLAAWLRDSLGIALTVMTIAVLLAYLLSHMLQKQISRPILALAATAKAVSDHRDYSARAPKFSQDELGVLTDGFNQMLAQIQEQDQTVRRNERRFRALIEQSSDGVALIDAANRILYVSPAVTTIEGYAAGELIGRNGMEDTHPDDLPQVREMVGQLLANPGRPMPVLWRRRHKAGHWLWLEGVATNLLDDPAVGAIVTNYRDVTERKRTEAEIARLNEDLERRVIERTRQLEAINQKLATANTELEAFSYSVSHDLRAPLRHIDGFAGLLAKRADAVLDAQSRRYISTISGAAKQMGRLIDDLLDFSRVGRTALHISEVDQNALLTSIIREGQYDQNNPALTWDIAPLPTVHADAAMLRQVWINLLENAVKYSGKNPRPLISIGSRPADTNPATHEFFVRDNGVGFDMAYADKLFGVFQRLHNPADFEGTGIGLANIRRIVVRHGGRTWAEGRVGEGAIFYFSLPVKSSSS